MPRIVSHLTDGPFVLFNVTFFILDDDFEAEDTLLGLSLLNLLGIDTKVMLEKSREP